MASVIRGSDNFDTADAGGGKALCTAWVNFDGTTTPPTIRDSYNVASVVRTGTGYYDVYFATPMDNVNYSSTITSRGQSNPYVSGCQIVSKDITKIRFSVSTNVSGYDNITDGSVNIFGGRN